MDTHFYEEINQALVHKPGLKKKENPFQKGD